jgi:hypothetical protein
MSAATHPRRADAGFTLIELMIASLITMVVMGVAFTTFDNALALNDSVMGLADSTQNLRAGTNLLIRDLMQAGRNIPIGGIAIPSGAGSSSIKRPGPPGKSYAFDNTTATTLASITTGSDLGPVVDGRTTDMVTMLMDDPLLGSLLVYPSSAAGNVPKLTATGDAFSVGPSTAWLQGDTANGIAAIQPGDLMYFLAATGTTVQAVTKVDSSTVYFESGDPFNFNQRGAAAGSIAQLLGTPAPLTVRRVFMYTYYVHEESTGVPRLTRAVNMHPGTALAGIIEDLDVNYDLVDGVVNPVNIADLPYTDRGVTYTSAQIRKVNVHLGVRSELKSPKTRDYLRNHVSTVIGVRNLAYVDRYQ